MKGASQSNRTSRMTQIQHISNVNSHISLVYPCNSDIFRLTICLGRTLRIGRIISTLEMEIYTRYF
jgi:hypothetical protein